MAVLWRSMENGGKVDASYPNSSGPPAGALKDKNTFFEKHVRISTTLPSEADMKKVVKQVWGDRQKNAKAKVVGTRGTRTKNEVYGKLTPSASGILFMNLNGFQTINAWIEANVNASGGRVHVPLLGGGVVVTYYDDTSTYEVINAGTLVLGIRVGGTADVHIGAFPKADTMQSKIVYHMNPTIRAPAS